MHEFDGSHADEESQHFYAGCPLCQRQAQTAAALFHGRDMEGRGVGNSLNVFWIGARLPATLETPAQAHAASLQELLP